MLSLLLSTFFMQHPANHLENETSPYLLQHAYNPVAWYPWGDEAIDRAKTENKVIFLSIGYSACHWCHVMERESFEDVATAKFMNKHFICIKVDREERPDLDDLYMTAVQKMTGSGGWPMSVWLTPDLKPFYGGTYFPPAPKYGRPSFMMVLENLSEAWDKRQDEVLEAAESLNSQLHTNFPDLDGDQALPSAADLAVMQTAWVNTYWSVYDRVDGGFGKAPKFPHATDLRFLLSVAGTHADEQTVSRAKEMCQLTLQKMASGGMYDQLAGGFARYSVDEKWLIPHFEKMLYDQGTLIPAYLHGYRLNKNHAFAAIARDSCDYLLREMQGADGGFYSSTDADSEGEEGKYFVWTPDEIKAELNNELAKIAIEFYGVSEKGNFEHGKSALTNYTTGSYDAAQLQEIRETLLTARQQRIAPNLDDKIITGWNGLAINALAEASWVLREPRYLQSAERAADFVLSEIVDGDGNLLRAYRAGRAQHSAVLEDYSYMLRALLAIFQANGDAARLTQAQNLAERMVDLFWDPKTGIFFDSDGLQKNVIHRRQTPTDGAIPSANAVAIEGLVKLAAFTGIERFRKIAVEGMLATMPYSGRSARSFSGTLVSYPYLIELPAVAVVVGNGATPSLGAWQGELSAPEYFNTLPVFSAKAQADSKLAIFTNRTASEGVTTMYLCRGQTCEAPRTLALPE
jgi:hypothetical protein